MIDQVTQASGSKQKRRTNSGLNAYNGPWGPEQALHLSRRTIYGTKKADLVMLTALGPQGAVNQLLEWPISAPAPPVNNYNNANYTDPTVPAG
ncbi:MAG: hypothetical protein ABIV51_12915 [Saprospiraceae bacterium]